MKKQGDRRTLPVQDHLSPKGAKAAAMSAWNALAAMSALSLNRIAFLQFRGPATPISAIV